MPTRLRWRRRGSKQFDHHNAHNEKDHAWAWSLRFVWPMVTAASHGAS